MNNTLELVTLHLTPDEAKKIEIALSVRSMEWANQYITEHEPAQLKLANDYSALLLKVSEQAGL